MIIMIFAYSAGGRVIKWPLHEAPPSRDMDLMRCLRTLCLWRVRNLIGFEKDLVQFENKVILIAEFEY